MLKIIVAVLIVLNSLCAQAQSFNGQISLPDGRLLLVTEGALEPRSVGSFSIRLYAAENADFPYDDFVVGIIRPRDGSIEKIELVDLKPGGIPELLVTIRSAGSGGYLAAQAFAIGPREIRLLSALPMQAPNADIVKQLQDKLSGG